MKVIFQNSNIVFASKQKKEKVLIGSVVGWNSSETLNFGWGASDLASIGIEDGPIWLQISVEDSTLEQDLINSASNITYMLDLANFKNATYGNQVHYDNYVVGQEIRVQQTSISSANTKKIILNVWQERVVK